MKKLILVVAIAMTTLLHAQDTTTDKKLSFGVKAGVNFANNTGNGVEYLLFRETSSGNSKLGIAGGLFMEYKLSEKFALQPELLYSQQGFKKDFSEFNTEVKLELAYINIPLMVKYYAIDDLSLEVGPQIGFLMNANSVQESRGEKGKQDIKDEFKSIDFGLNFGLGYQLENGLGINARYTLGLIDIFEFVETSQPAKNSSIEKTSTRFGEDLILKNRVFSIGLSYIF